MSDGSERRGSPRQSVDFKARIESQNQRGVARVRSLSRLGALIEAEQSFPVGTVLRIVLDGADPGAALDVRGQILRSAEAHGVHAFAVMFAPLPPPVLARIDALLARATQVAE
jgi:hypothetical protein